MIETPNIDALAAGGLKFTDAHVSASHCIPTRVGIMTGRYPWRFGPPQPGGPWGYLGLRYPEETFTLGDLFKQAGYQTGYLGKWHLGTNMTTKDGGVQNDENVDFTKPLKVGPPQFGFDESFILPGSLDMFPYAFVKNNQWQGSVTAKKGWSAFNRVGSAAEDFEDHQVLETFYGQAESFIGKQNSEKPFFLYLALTAPHTPISPGEKWQGRSKLGIYGDFVMEVDHAVQRVMAALNQKGLLENTLVLFSSDHGPGSYAGNIRKATPGQIHLLEEKGHYPSGPHRGYKFSAYEGGLRVPLIAHWPKIIPAGSESSALVGLNDFMATFAELTSTDIPKTAGTDSISFAPVLKDPSQKGLRSDLVMQSVRAFVIRDGDWKLCLCPGSGATGVYGNEPTPQDAWQNALKQFEGDLTADDLLAAPFVQLFDVSKDLHEDHNLASEHPDRVAKMVKLLQNQIATGRSTPGPDLKNGRDNIPLHPNIPNFVRQRMR